MNRAFCARAVFGLALLMPLPTEGEEWLSLSCWPDPHGWYALITKLETTSALSQMNLNSQFEFDVGGCCKTI